MYPRIASHKTAEAFRAYLVRAGIPLAFDDSLEPAAASPLAQPLEADGVRIGNRFCILPMEGWDGTRAGEPSELTCRRWRHFGISGAKLIWGGEAVAVRADGRANPNHELLSARTRDGRYGGALDNRTRFLRNIVDGIQASVPGLKIGVRLSVFDTVPYRKDERGGGVPETPEHCYDAAFGLLHEEDMPPA